jgi:hypothetical protein
MNPEHVIFELLLSFIAGWISGSVPDLDLDWIRFNQVSGSSESGSGSRRAKTTTKIPTK